MVNAGMQPREALREVEARLTAAGCPDADFDAGELFRLVTGQDARLADRPLTAEQAAKLEALTARRSAGAGDRLAAAGSGNCPAGGKRLGGHRMPQRLRRQRPVHSGPEIVPIKLQK